MNKEEKELLRRMCEKRQIWIGRDGRPRRSEYLTRKELNLLRNHREEALAYLKNFLKEREEKRNSTFYYSIVKITETLDADGIEIPIEKTVVRADLAGKKYDTPTLTLGTETFTAEELAKKMEPGRKYTKEELKKLFSREIEEKREKEKKAAEIMRGAALASDGNDYEEMYGKEGENDEQIRG